MAAGFPMNETDYKPWAALGGWYQGENAADADAMRNEAVAQAQFETANNPLKEMVDQRHKQALTEQALAQARKFAEDKPYDQARAQKAQMEMLLPGLNALISPYEAVEKSGDSNRMAQALGVGADGVGGQGINMAIDAVRKVNPQLADQLAKSADPMAALKSVYGDIQRISNPYSSYLKGESANDAKRNVAEIGYLGRKYAADAMLRAKEISAAAAKSGQATLSTDKLAAQLIQQQLAAGIIDQQTAMDAIASLKTAAVEAKPMPTGIAPQVGPDGRIQLVNKPGATKPTVPIAPQAGAQPQPAPNDFDKQWSKLKSGEKLVGPDGKTYVKK